MRRRGGGGVERAEGEGRQTMLVDEGQVYLR